MDLNKSKITIPLPKLGKVETAFSIYWLWLHEVRFEFEENSHPSWKGYSEKVWSRIREIKKTMTQEELEAFNKRVPFGTVGVISTIKDEIKQQNEGATENNTNNREKILREFIDNFYKTNK